MEGVMDYQVHREIFPPKTSTSIKKVSLTHSDISAGMLATIIRIPTGLEGLTISWGGLWNIEGSVPWANLELLGKSRPT